MSATDRTTASFEVGAAAHVNFRVRCESLGHGEEVYLVAEEDKGRTKVGAIACRAVMDPMSITGFVEISTEYWLNRIVYHGRFHDAYYLIL
jgi:hypothetical protein